MLLNGETCEGSLHPQHLVTHTATRLTVSLPNALPFLLFAAPTPHPMQINFSAAPTPHPKLELPKCAADLAVN